MFTILIIIDPLDFLFYLKISLSLLTIMLLSKIIIFDFTYS